jgi:hypothetical protein
MQIPIGHTKESWTLYLNERTEWENKISEHGTLAEHGSLVVHTSSLAETILDAIADAVRDDRENRQENAVEALKHIVRHIEVVLFDVQNSYSGRVLSEMLADIREIIASTVGTLE